MWGKQKNDVTEQRHDPRYYRIKTPLKEGCRVMYRYTMFGYAYGGGNPLDALWVGYLYNIPIGGPPIQAFNEVKYIPGASATTYYQDGYLYLKVGRTLMM